MSKLIEKNIKQITGIEPGWRFHYLVEIDNNISLDSLPVTGQALVERIYSDTDEPDTRIEFIILDDDWLCLQSDVDETYREGSNTYPAGVLPPGKEVSPREVARLTERFRKKQSEQKAA